MSKIHRVLTDLDGTMVQAGTHKASKAIVSALDEAHKQGIAVSVATGRPFWMAKDLLRRLGFNEPCIFEGGGVIINPVTGEVLWSKMLPAETARLAVEILLKYCSVIKYEVGLVKGEEVDTKTITKPTLSVWASVPTELADSIVALIQRLPDVAVYPVNGPGGDYSRAGIQVTHIAADKQYAVRKLLQLTGTNAENTLGIGDNNNDLPLFMGAGIKIAMGNASQELKAAADHIVPAVSEDGFAIALQRFAL